MGERRMEGCCRRISRRFCHHTREVVYLSGGEMASIGSDETTFSTLSTAPPSIRGSRGYPFDAQSAEKGRFQHFMHKEIHDQPESVISTLRGRVSFEDGVRYASA